MEKLTSSVPYVPSNAMGLEDRVAALHQRRTELENQAVDARPTTPAAVDEDDPPGELNVVAVIDPISAQAQKTVLASLISSILDTKNTLR